MPPPADRKRMAARTPSATGACTCQPCVARNGMRERGGPGVSPAKLMRVLSRLACVSWQPRSMWSCEVARVAAHCAVGRDCPPSTSSERLRGSIQLRCSLRFPHHPYEHRSCMAQRCAMHAGGESTLRTEYRLRPQHGQLPSCEDPRHAHPTGWRNTIDGAPMSDAVLAFASSPNAIPLLFARQEKFQPSETVRAPADPDR